MHNNEKFLVKALGRTDIIALGFGAIVGWSWLILAPEWIISAGVVGTLLAFVLGSIVIIFIGLVYGELTAAMPVAGGDVVFGYRAFGRRFGWLAGWIITLAFLGVAAWESIAFATAMDGLFNIPKSIYLWDVAGYPVYLTWSLMGASGAAIITILNMFNTRPAILFQVMGTVGVIITGLVIFFGGVTEGSFENVGSLITNEHGFISVLVIVPSMLVGFEVISQSAEEMNLKRKDIGKTIIVAIVLATLWYLIVIVGLAFAAPYEIKFSAKIPAADILSYTFDNPSFGVFVIFGGVLGILTCWNAFFMAVIRLIYSMSRAKMLPAIFLKTSHKYGTPWVAILFVGAICVFSAFLGQNALIWFVDSSSICVLIAYFLVSISFLKIRIKEPNMIRPFKLKHGKIVGVIAMVLSGAYLITYITFIVVDEAQYVSLAIILLWVVAGYVMYRYSKRYRIRLSAQQYEILVFGERFARVLEEEAHNEKR